MIFEKVRIFSLLTNAQILDLNKHFVNKLTTLSLNQLYNQP